MSVVEQTEIDIEHTHLIWLGDFESAWEVSIEEMFQNYLKQVNVEHVMGTSLNKLGLGLRCILACES